MNPMILHLSAQNHTRELHRAADHAGRDTATRPKPHTTITTPRLFKRRAFRPVAA